MTRSFELKGEEIDTQRCTLPRANARKVCIIKEHIDLMNENFVK